MFGNGFVYNLLRKGYIVKCFALLLGNDSSNRVPFTMGSRFSMSHFEIAECPDFELKTQTLLAINLGSSVFQSSALKTIF